MPSYLQKRKTLTAAAMAATLAMPVAAQDTQDIPGLSSIYSLATDYDSTIRAADYDYEAAIQRLPLARSAFKPQLDAAFQIGRNELNSDQDGVYDNSRLSLSIRQSLFNRENGGILDQAKLGVKQAKAQLHAQQQNLILRTATTYFDVLRAQVEVQFSQSELQAIDRQREQAERRFDVGLVPVTDVRTAQAQYDLAVAAEIAASNRLENAREALFVLSGVRPELIKTLDDEMPLVPPTPANADSWVELAMDQNLDLAAARLAAQSASAGVSSVRGQSFPTLDLVGIAQTTDTDQLGRDDSDSGEIRLEVRMPLYTGGRIGTQVRQAKAESRSAEQRMLAQERAAAQQTRDAYRGVTGSISRATALRQALVSTRKSAEATDAGFRAGTRTSVEVLRALRDVFRAESDYAGARYDYIINYLSLKASAGTLSDDDITPINKYLVMPGSN